MKVIKKNVEVESIELVNGEPTVIANPVTLYFAMNLKAQRIIEQETKTPLMKFLNFTDKEKATEKLFDSDSMLSIASACWLKVENGKIEQNEVTAQEFKDSNYAELIGDLDFKISLYTMIADYFGAGSKKATAQNDGKKVKN